ncbi:MAG: hypothetical protein R2909_17425 [Gemmatimonadales bacterium]
MEIQVFGVRRSSATRAALRFFAERRVKTHFVDFAVRGPSAGELRRFVERFGVDRLIDRESRAFADRGLHAARYGADRWLEILVDEPAILVMPLVRWKQQLSVGAAEPVWREWVAKEKDPS